MKAYSVARTPEEESFGVYLSKARIVVENAFGRLKGRWRILQKKIDANIELVPSIVATCCILHNIAEKKGLPMRSQWMETSEEYNRAYPQPSSSAVGNELVSANDIRDNLKDFMAQNFPILRSHIV